MNTKIYLQRSFFAENAKTIMENDEFKVNLFKYSSGVEAIEVTNSRGKIIVLPYMGQMIWRVEFDGIDLTHPMHGEFCCADLDTTWIEFSEDEVIIGGEYEYCQGFGFKYLARPSVSLKANATNIKISMQVKNLTSVEMPLQYMCHINHHYVDKGEFKANIPDEAFKLRESIPSHIKPTKEWFDYTDEIKKAQVEGKTLTKLENPDLYNTEVVFLADRLDKYTDEAVVEINSPEGYGFKTQFSTKDFKYGTRWIMYTPEQQVSSCIIPGTCRPEGFLAAKKAGSLLMLQPDEEKTFSVITGLK